MYMCKYLYLLECIVYVLIALVHVLEVMNGQYTLCTVHVHTCTCGSKRVSLYLV